MDFKIFNGKEEERAVHLKLVTAFPSGMPTLVACHKDGTDIVLGNILSITSSGNLVLHAGINSVTCLDLDSNGRIKVKNDLDDEDGCNYEPRGETNLDTEVS